MALPMMSTPTFTLKVPSTGATVKFRPFLVKEEKALLIAQQSEDVKVMVDTLKDIIKACVLTQIDVDSLATFDLEYIFTQIRSKSVGETVELYFPCDLDHGEDNEKARVKISIDISNISVEKDPNHSNKIMLFQDVGVVMSYPTLESLHEMYKTDESDMDAAFNIVADSIDYIFQGDEIFYGKEQKKSELIMFLENLTTDQFMKIQEFFKTMPRLKKEVQYNCPVCGKHHNKVLEGMQSFF